MAATRTDTPLVAPARVRARGLSLWQAAWLCLCLLLAQHAGLVHRVEHGGFGVPGANVATAAIPAVTTASAATPTDANDAAPLAQKATTHSCVLFDGATIADLHCGALPPPVLAYGKPVNPAALAWRWPDLPPRHPFRSRAPPAPVLQA